MLEFTRKLDTAQYQNDNPEYEIYHACIFDSNCDLLILACSPDKETKILIPVHKSIVIENLKYFEAMFREGSNWKESRDDSDRQTKNDISKPQTIEIETHNPKFFAFYLKSIYTKKLKITPKNCIDYFMIAEFLLDEQLEMIKKYLRNHLRYDNIIDIAEKTEQFDEDISVFVSKNNYGHDDDHTIINRKAHARLGSFCKKLLKLPSKKFCKMMSILEMHGPFGKTWIGRMCSYRCFSTFDSESKSSKKSDKLTKLFDEIIEDEQYLKIAKLKNMMHNAKKDTYVELDLVESNDGLGIEIKNVIANADQNWSHGKMIFPVKGIFSYTIEVCSFDGPTYILAGWTNKCDLDEKWTSNPVAWHFFDNNRNKALGGQWPKSIFLLSANGTIYGFDPNKKTDKTITHGCWSEASDKMITSLHGGEIHFHTSGPYNKPTTSHIKCSDFDIKTDDNLYPAV